MIFTAAKICVVSILKRLRALQKHCERIQYNKRHDTAIKSLKADLSAVYGVNVRVDENATVAGDCEIGDYSYVNKNSSLETCTVGRFCSISSNVNINPWEHDLLRPTTHPVAYGDLQDRERPRVIIGNDVLISLNVVILGANGVKIGNGAVIAAGAVVTKDVAPYEVVGGVPARHIKYRFSEEKISFLQELKWWDWPIEKINANLGFLSGESYEVK